MPFPCIILLVNHISSSSLLLMAIYVSIATVQNCYLQLINRFMERIFPAPHRIETGRNINL